MDKVQMLKEIEEALNVVSKGILSDEEFPDDKIDELRDYHRYIKNQKQISPKEQTMIIDEIGKLKK
ncbi:MULTISPECIES: DUF1128 family protein [Nosocomiicoccus]|uniref:DUF1128 family protein n=1 Tax=Nosocomiicoccus massiliensis TaxID=1232430 RepID=A0AAF1BSD3_9STAP|nr:MULTISPECIES: DUF1128 family protein [Nosocomiicoccus]MDK6863895.1 DUF1128 family protein [Nosocomiicoccus ampullae]OFL48697.1 hypothetical protein HMPREF2767_07335 [Nosocomiicoccus sp. HMSC067E10]OFO53210.1 hypothetical protein HMPREF3029_05920 [Nosocomiicoccus sp. HMSC059G07]OFS64333.1 hypothetical protein HMPREF3177_00625 [Nosocomiicoccus sp. HMSC09A07]WOS96848.1 DUF1128 family protein [Nosocomiicoccus massiliensis]